MGLLSPSFPRHGAGGAINQDRGTHEAVQLAEGRQAVLQI